MGLHTEDEDTEVEAKPAFYSVAIYLLDRVYGGPEEGGWYYTAGHPAEEVPEGIIAAFLIRIFEDEKEANHWATAMQRMLDTGPNHGRPEISSVLSHGAYRAIVQPGWPKPFPAVRPHFE